jgi:hypothetical protein
MTDNRWSPYGKIRILNTGSRVPVFSTKSECYKFKSLPRYIALPKRSALKKKIGQDMPDNRWSPWGENRFSITGPKVPVFSPIIEHYKLLILTRYTTMPKGFDGNCWELVNFLTGEREMI